MQGAAHHEAVSALRNAGSCIRMMVLREKPVHREAFDPGVPQGPPDLPGRQPREMDVKGQRSKRSQLEKAEECLSKEMETVVCNGNSSVDLEKNRIRTVSELKAEVLKKDSLQGIPRIILTHPSTSDEDVEILTQILPGRDLLRDLEGPDKRAHAECSSHPS
ncbi:uncharacterized protein [Nothobranchius furzeri]|uniref:uncharacterized protein n=1 Tax=Nothobranchius furzeri TaxID=105023 RepID=UPI00390465D1